MKKISRILYQTAKRIASNAVISQLDIRERVKFIVLIIREKRYEMLNEEQKKRNLQLGIIGKLAKH